jgi:hypothetical protein
MEYTPTMKDSISTSVSIGIFKSFQESLLAHTYKTELVKIPLNIFKNYNVDNFDSNRLQESATQSYPLDNRPRGDEDISSVEYYQTQIKQQKEITPIWMIQQDQKYILLDGSHRIVASFIEETDYINSYIITI